MDRTSLSFTTPSNVWSMNLLTNHRSSSVTKSKEMVTVSVDLYRGYILLDYHNACYLFKTYTGLNTPNLVTSVKRRRTGSGTSNG